MRKSHRYRQGAPDTLLITAVELRLVKFFNCDNRTVLHGKQDLESDLSKENDRVRQIGAGRKPIIETTAGTDDAFLDVIEDHTAGSPMDETIKWYPMHIWW